MCARVSACARARECVCVCVCVCVHACVCVCTCVCVRVRSCESYACVVFSNMTVAPLTRASRPSNTAITDD